MHQLGAGEVEAHSLVGCEEINKMDILITVGNVAEVWQRFNKDKYKLNKHFRNATNAGRYLQKNIKKGDVVLFKGGHLIRLEKIVALLTKCSKECLVRQEKYYTDPKFELNQEIDDYVK